MTIESYGEDEVRVLCPFHGNSNTSAMSVSVPDGKFMCFNPLCNEAGGLIDLVMGVSKCSFFDAIRIIDDSHEGDSFKVSFRSKKKSESIEIPDSKIDEWNAALKATPEALAYIHSRKITDESIEHFRLGYSAAQNLLVTPMFSEHGDGIGGIGRSVDGKVFKNIPGTKTARSLFNINNAKMHRSVIICESNFDAIRIHQAGYPGVVATCGGHFSEDHLQQIAYYFSKVIIMTDVDGKKIEPSCRKCVKAGLKYCVGHDAGRDLGNKIAALSSRAGVSVKWAFSGECGTIYPHGVKDAGDMTDEQIRNCIENSISNFEYNTL